MQAALPPEIMAKILIEIVLLLIPLLIWAIWQLDQWRMGRTARARRLLSQR